MKLSVIGSGYVGLVAGTCFAEAGNHVICMDVDEKKIADLKNGIIPIYEPGLEAMLKRNVDHGKLTFTTDMKHTVHNSDIIFIAVGTPPDEDGSADLTYVLAVAKAIGQYMTHPKIVIDKSTVPVGTAALVKAEIQTQTDIDVHVVSNPEFLKEGAAIDDFMYPDRVVIGTDSDEVGETMRQLYAPFVRTGNPIIVMDIVSAELTKYAANSMLATKISFMNEMANLCHRVGADIENVRRGIASDRRIGKAFIFAGVGYGGSCFPKDVKALIHTSSKYDYNMRILTAVEDVNQDQKTILIPRILEHFGGSVKGKTIALWGLSFKPKTDDMREAPARVLIKTLHELGATLKAHDPVALEEARRLGLDKMVTLCEDNYEAIRNSDALILVTEWLEYREPDFEYMKKNMNSFAIFDGRNIYNPEKVRSKGFTYYGIGRQ
ncbi:UDP-glucose/GDP-mannose dehydrogenase family protein [bacterium]|nr:UDP-glucose/GDP-mannose dehydrogenase family protein [bacterium]